MTVSTTGCHLSQTNAERRLMFWRQLAFTQAWSPGDRGIVNVRQLVCPPSLFMLWGVLLIQMASLMRLLRSWLSLAISRVPSQLMTWFYFPVWSVMADLLYTWLADALCVRVYDCPSSFWPSFLCSSIRVLNFRLVSPMYEALQD